MHGQSRFMTFFSGQSHIPYHMDYNYFIYINLQEGDGHFCLRYEETI